MQKLGFHPIWINWIRICISLSSFSILINGSPFGYFTPSRGLRQGNPLSPFLFILGTEVLSLLFRQQESLGLLKGIRIARNCYAISHLLFADDLIIFAKTTSSEACIIKSCLQFYCRCSGQKVNEAKSSILFSKNTVVSCINSIKGIIPYKVTSSIAFYLGLPIIIGKSKKEAFQPILDKVFSKINGWHAKTLSQAGITILIKATAAAIPTYVMSTFLLPSSICKALDRTFKNPNGKSQNLSLKSWKSICIPRNQGGLGIRGMEATNLALITKLGWKLLNNSDNLWVQQL
jgi:hypothetical protein